MTSSTQKVTYEHTPNPATLKFHLHQNVTDQGFECSSIQDSDRSPLATKLFGFPWTSSVYVGIDFITVTKQDWVDWQVLAEPLSDLIGEHLQSGEPVVVEVTRSATASDIDPNDSEVVKQIKGILNAEIRPVVALDGGDIVFNKYENNILYVKLNGSCAGCPSSVATLKDGVEHRMKELIPGLQEVVAV